MSEDLSGKCFCVFDHYGLFVGLAGRLAESGARVLYQTPVDRYDRINELVIGDGFKDIEWVEEFWPLIGEINCFVFPDIRHSGLQGYLRDCGYNVWGSQTAMELEQNRRFFLEKLDELGLDVPPHQFVKGISNLKAFLRDRKDIFIKVSKIRGTWETSHWKSWDENWKDLDEWAVKFGGLKEHVNFICFDKIDTDLEIGADTYCIDGQWPQLMLHGIEKKNKAYVAAVTDFDEMPGQLTDVMLALSPFLKKSGYRNQWSMENRVLPDKNYFIDATCRGGLPSTGTFLAAKNIAEVIYHGSMGQVVQIDYGFKFSAECMVNGTGDDGWMTATFDPEVRKNLLAQQCCEVGGQLWYPPNEAWGDHLGWLRSTGDTLEEVMERMNELADILPDGTNAEVEALSDAIKEIESEQDQGIHFTDDEIPDPSVVLE